MEMPIGREQQAIQRMGQYTDQQIQKASIKLTSKVDKMHEKIEEASEHLAHAKELKSNMSLKEIIKNPSQYLALRKQISTLTTELKKLQKDVDPMAQKVSRQLEKLHTIASTENVMKRTLEFKEFIGDNPIEGIHAEAVAANFASVQDAALEERLLEDARFGTESAPGGATPVPASAYAPGRVLGLNDPEYPKAVGDFKEKAQPYITALKAKLDEVTAKQSEVIARSGEVMTKEAVAIIKERGKLQTTLNEIQKAVDNPDKAFAEYNATEDKDLTGEQVFSKLLEGYDRMAALAGIKDSEGVSLTLDAPYRAAISEFQDIAAKYVRAYQEAAEKVGPGRQADGFKEMAAEINKAVQNPDSILVGPKSAGARMLRETLDGYERMARADRVLTEGQLATMKPSFS